MVDEARYGHVQVARAGFQKGIALELALGPPDGLLVRLRSTPHVAGAVDSLQLPQWRGSHSTNTLPSPFLLFTVSEPPSASTIRLLIARPIPTPGATVGSSRTNS